MYYYCFVWDHWYIFWQKREGELKLLVTRPNTFIRDKITEHHGDTLEDRLAVREYVVQSSKEVHF